MPRADFTLADHGSIVVLSAQTAAAREWRDRYLPDDAPTWGRNGVAIERNYAGAILAGIEDAGLVVR